MKTVFKGITGLLIAAIFGGLFGLGLNVIFWKGYLITLFAFFLISTLNATLVYITNRLKQIIDVRKFNASKKV